MTLLRPIVLAIGMLTSAAASFASISYSSGAITGSTSVALGATETYSFTWHAVVPTMSGGNSVVTPVSFASRTLGAFTLVDPDNVSTDFSVYDVSPSATAPLASSYDYSVSFGNTFNKVGTYTISFDGNLRTTFNYSVAFVIGGNTFSQSQTAYDSIRGNLATPLTVTVTAAVPEPEAYALMLAGVGVVGVATRRRKPN